MNTHRTKKPLYITILVSILLLVLIPMTIFADDTTEDFNSVLEKTFVFHTGSGYYYANGVKTFYDTTNENYISPSKDGKVLLSLNLLRDICDMGCQWDSSTQILKLTKGDTTIVIPVGYDYMTVNGTDQAISSPVLVEGNSFFMPAYEILGAFGYATFAENDLMLISNQVVSSALEYYSESFNDLFFTYVFSSDFEDIKEGTSAMLPGTKISEGWSFNNWANPATPNVDASITDEEYARGSHCAYITAVDNSMAGFETPKLPLDKSAFAYEIYYKVKSDSNYNNNNPMVMFMLYKDGRFVANVIKGGSVYNADDWTEDRYMVVNSQFKGFDANQFTVAFTSCRNANNANPVAGKLYLDDIRIRIGSPVSDTLKSDIRPSLNGSMYALGETVNYKPVTPEDFKGFKAVDCDVYNSYDEIVHQETIKINDFMTNGWSWVPAEPGYYHATFTAIQKDGTGIPVEGFFAEVGGKHLASQQEYFERTIHHFIVFKNRSKPIEERNQKMFYSTKASDPLDAYFADQVGFSGARIHWIPWGPYGSDQVCIQPEKDVWNWDFMDERIKVIRDYGMNIIGDILYTPKWASSHPEYGDSINSYGMYDYSIYVPSDMKYWTDFVTALTQRYNDDIKIWEIWNEPHLPGGSCFWNDSPTNYVALLKAAYTAIKSVQPGDSSIVTIGGIGGNRYLPFYKAIMQTDVSNYFDVLAIHGGNPPPDLYNAVAVKAGYEPKEYMTTEGHHFLLNATNTTNLDVTEPELSLQMLRQYLLEFRQNAVAMTLFQVYSNSQYELETLPFFKRVNITRDCSAMFRNKPYIEPKHMVATLHTFFDIIGKDVTYHSEYILENNQNAFVLISDGEPLMAVWREGGNKYDLDPQIINCFTDSTEIYDWEERNISLDDLTLCGTTMYFIKGLDLSKIDAIVPAVEGNTIVNKYYNTVADINVPSADATEAPLFNAKTFLVPKDKEINWIQPDNWVQSAPDIERDPSFDAKYAISMDTTGMYLMVDVTDNTFTQNIDKGAGSLWMFDSVQFSFDTVGDSAIADRVDFQAGLIDGKPTLFKETSPYVEGDLVTGTSKSLTTLNPRYIHVEQEDGHILYKIFVPTLEMRPYAYIGQKDVFRFSILMNDNNGVKRVGYLEWSSGIGASKDPAHYGKINVPAIEK